MPMQYPRNLPRPGKHFDDSIMNTLSNAPQMIDTPCPVCSSTLGTPFFSGEEQPLATLGWPKSVEEAQDMTLYPLEYVQCPCCTHVWNRCFTYEAIPYTNNPNRMFNKGSIWQGHLKETAEMAISILPPNPTIIDIGCGEGHFVRSISKAFAGNGRFMGFDPNATPESGVGVEFYADYFDPMRDVNKFEPDLLVMRHVLEHLTDPAAFVEQLAWGAAQLSKPVRLFAEVPCIDKVFSTYRLVDFFYEHPSQFTTQSFQTLMTRSGTIRTANHGYDGEVVYALVDLGVSPNYRVHVQQSLDFHDRALDSRKTIRSQLKDLIAAGKKVAIWGGTGKAAAFIHFFDVNAQEFPLVVDSDFEKVGTFVPKTGQLIQYRDVLKTEKVDIIIIPSQWRAKDIIAEMIRENIHVHQILIEHDGSLVDFSLNYEF
jgi:hypothetical protein